LIHLIQFSRDGHGFRWRYHRLPLDFISDTCQNLSEAIVIILIISIGRGWTLIDGTTKDIIKLWSTGFIVIFVQFLLELWSRRYDDDFSTFHDHDHWAGYILMMMRVVTCGILLYFSKSTMKKVGDDTQNSDFIKKFSVLGSIWLLLFPITVFFVAPAVAPYKRHFIVTVATVLLQSIALGVMLVMFLGLGESGKSYLKRSTIYTMGDFSGDALSPTNSSSSSSSSSGLTSRSAASSFSSSSNPGPPGIQTHAMSPQSIRGKFLKKVSVD
jgi:hypothetical protein